MCYNRDSVMACISGICFAVSERALYHVDYDRLLTQQAEVGTVTLPETCKPSAFGPEVIGFDFASVNVRALGCVHSPPQLLQIWHRYADRNLPLDHMMHTLIALDVLRTLQRGYLSVPLWAPVVQLLDLLYLLEEHPLITGAAFRVNECLKDLRGILRHAPHLGQPTEFYRRASELSRSLHSWIGELLAVRELADMGEPLQLKKGGKDFILEEGTIPGEVKARLEPEDALNALAAGSDKNQGSITCDLRSLLTTAALLLTNQLASAFGAQLARLMVVDITHSFLGVALLGLDSSVNGLPVADGLREGVRLVRADHEAVVICAHAMGFPSTFCGLCVARSDLEQLRALGQRELQNIAGKLYSRQLLALLASREPPQG
jgi:hypothetical protein